VPEIQRQPHDKPKKGQAPPDFTVEREHGRRDSYYIRFPDYIKEEDALQILFAQGKIPEGVVLEYQGVMLDGWTFRLRSTKGVIGQAAFVEFAPDLQKHFHAETPLSFTPEETEAHRKAQEEFLDSRPVYLGGQTVREALTLDQCKDHVVPGQVGKACWGERAGYFYWVGFDSREGGTVLEVQSSPKSPNIIKDWEWFLSHTPADYVSRAKDLPFAATFDPNSKANFTLNEADRLENELKDWEFRQEVFAFANTFASAAGAVRNPTIPAPSTAGQLLKTGSTLIQAGEAWKSALGGDQSELDMYLMALAGMMEHGIGLIGSPTNKPTPKTTSGEEPPHPGGAPAGEGKKVVVRGSGRGPEGGETTPHLGVASEPPKPAHTAVTEPPPPKPSPAEVTEPPTTKPQAPEPAGPKAASPAPKGGTQRPSWLKRRFQDLLFKIQVGITRPEVLPDLQIGYAGSDPAALVDPGAARAAPAAIQPAVGAIEQIPASFEGVEPATPPTRAVAAEVTPAAGDPWASTSTQIPVIEPDVPPPLQDWPADVRARIKEQGIPDITERRAAVARAAEDAKAAEAAKQAEIQAAAQNAQPMVATAGGSSTGGGTAQVGSVRSTASGGRGGGRTLTAVRPQVPPPEPAPSRQKQPRARVYSLENAETVDEWISERQASRGAADWIRGAKPQFEASQKGYQVYEYLDENGELLYVGRSGSITAAEYLKPGQKEPEVDSWIDCLRAEHINAAWIGDARKVRVIYNMKYQEMLALEEVRIPDAIGKGANLKPGDYSRSWGDPSEAARSAVKDNPQAVFAIEVHPARESR
jgi:hypothetical protein